MNLIIAVKVQEVSPSLIGVLTTILLSPTDKIQFVGPEHLPKILGQKDEGNH